MDTSMLLKFAAAFVFVISLMLLLSWFLKKMGLATPAMLTGAKRRLKIIEHLPIDHRRRLVLVRRDDKEHLLVLDADHATVIESGIQAAPEDIVELTLPKEQKNV